MSNAFGFLFFLALVAAAALSGSQFMPGEWYSSLNKPSWTPSNGVFPIVWTVLYVMIAAAGWLVWRRSGLSPAVAAWAVGLILNALWSYAMFGQQNIAAALVVIVLLLLSIVAFIWKAWPVDRLAAYLFVPYLVWVAFATALNAVIWQLNPAA